MPVGSYARLKVKAPPAVDSRRLLNFISETPVIDPKYLGVKSRRKRGKEPRRKEDQADRSKTVGPLGF